MTKREACERIVADNNRREVFSAEKFYADKSSLECLKALSRELGWPEDCNGKTEEECNLLGFEVHKNWMEERRDEMKVFSREKYLSVMYKIDPNGAEDRREFEWPSQCDGKTEEECNALGYVVTPYWMEEIR